MSLRANRSIAIVGGGASGVLLALHMLRDGAPGLRLTLIEKIPELGRGVAYATRHQCHVLNVVAGNMSAFPDDPDHFWRWLQARNLVADDNRFVFVARSHYGDYLAELLAEAADERLAIVRAGATAIADGAVQLDTGAAIAADAIVLATGHEESQPRGKGIAIRPGSAADTPLDPDAPVLLLGSGLSMVDAWLSLDSAGHRGPVTIVSRHGLLPLAHRQVDRATLANVPLGASTHDVMRWLRAAVRQQGGDWRGVVDGLRPHNQRIWMNWSPAARRAFLEHVRPYWNIHRHRLPATIHARLHAALADGRLTLRAARLTGLSRDGADVVANLRPRSGAPETLRVARIYDCGGLATDVEQSSNPLLRDLVVRGDIRPDPLRIGVDVTTDAEVIARDGTVSGTLFALGPLTRGTFFEIEAVPDIRVQVAALAARLSADIQPAPSPQLARLTTPSVSSIL